MKLEGFEPVIRDLETGLPAPGGKVSRRVEFVGPAQHFLGVVGIYKGDTTVEPDGQAVDLYIRVGFFPHFEHLYLFSQFGYALRFGNCEVLNDEAG